MDNKEIAELLKRYREGGQLSKEEKMWLDSFYLHYAKNATEDISEEDLQENLAKVEVSIKRQTSKSAPIKKINPWWYAAAAILVVFFLGYYFQMGPFNQQEELHLANGQLKQIVLEDGTKITLNASSKLIYPKSFKDATHREVTLIGEAYFDVAKNPDKPFLVHTPRMEIRVLGTAFNVRDYQEDKNAETSLIHGKVEIWKTGKEAQKFVLQPKEKFVLQETSSESTTNDQRNKPTTSQDVAINIQPFDISEDNGTAIETEWMLKRITIKDETLAQIAQRLERMYAVKITISNKAIADQLYSATFDNERIEDVLEGLQTVAPFRYKKNVNDHIEIYK